MTTKLPSWNNSKFFSHCADSRVQDSIITLQQNCLLLSANISHFTIDSNSADLPDILNQFEDCLLSILDLRSFSGQCLAVNAKDTDALKLQNRAQTLKANLDGIFLPIINWIKRLPELEWQEIKKNNHTASFTFYFSHERRFTPFLLSNTEETLLAQMSVTGLHAWGNLYSQIAGGLTCQFGEETAGLADASNLLHASDRFVREHAFRSINQAWESQADAVAAILSAINGWRLDEFKRRSKTTPLHYLDMSCHQNRIDRKTLNSLMSATKKSRNLGHRAMFCMHKFNNILDPRPYDAFAPPNIPTLDDNIPYSQALDIIAESFASIDTEMADFVYFMDKNGWIDAASSENRSGGAFCDSFATVREPRVFVTYQGSLNNVITLAHELGHAWHSWVLKDTPFMETDYPMTLAETASIFAETLVRNTLLKRAKSIEEKIAILWQEGERATAFLVNVPSRFELEQSIVEARKISVLSVSDLKKLCTTTWQDWYQESLVEYDDMFWASKLHFSIPELGFYNYPYTFGYLLAMGIYAQEDKPEFALAYRNLLRDTGRYTAEELIQKHLGKNLNDEQFWLDSIKIIEHTVLELEKTLNSGRVKS